jgi:hypothetical protein
MFKTKIVEENETFSVQCMFSISLTVIVTIFPKITLQNTLNAKHPKHVL